VTGYLAAARRDGSLRQTLVAAALLAVLFRFGFGESWTYTAVVVAAASAAGLVTDYADHRGTPTATRHLWLGVVVGGLAGGWVALDPAVPPLAVVGLSAAAWLLLDGWTARRSDHPDAFEAPGGDLSGRFEDEGVLSNVRTFRDIGDVGRAIDRGADTPAAIATELDRPVDEVEADLADLEAAGVVERVDPDASGGENETESGAERYRQTNRDWSVASWPRRAAGRLVRPFRLLVAG